MAKAMNELEEMFANVEDVNYENLFDGEEDVENDELDFLDDEDIEAVEQDQDDLDFDDENDFEDDGLDWEEDMEDEEDDDDFEFEESDEDDDDLFTLTESLRQAKLDEDDYLATLGKPTAEKMIGDFGPWVKVTLPFIIKNPETGEKVTVLFFASNSMNPSKRLYPILKGILGVPPTAGYNLKNVEGKRVRVSIQHRTDEKGNVWENVIAVRPLIRRK